MPYSDRSLSSHVMAMLRFIRTTMRCIVQLAQAPVSFIAYIRSLPLNMPSLAKRPACAAGARRGERDASYQEAVSATKAGVRSQYVGAWYVKASGSIGSKRRSGTSGTVIAERRVVAAKAEAAEREVAVKRIERANLKKRDEKQAVEVAASRDGHRDLVAAREEASSANRKAALAEAKAAGLQKEVLSLRQLLQEYYRLHH